MTGDSTHQRADNAGVRFPPPLIYIIGLLIGVVASRLHPLPTMPVHVTWWLGGALLLGWLVVWGGSIPRFAAAKTPINPTQPVTALITSGMFRFTRNPLYLGLALAYLGIAVLANSLWALVLFIPVQAIVNILVVPKEERYLERRFGGEYLDYKRRVRRWL